MSDNETKVLNCITNSFPLPITRSELAYLTGLKDRCVRRSIQKLRHSDHWIYSCSFIPGYRLTKDAREWDSFVDNWNLSNKYNMLKKSDYSEMQMRFGLNTERYSVYAKGTWDRGAGRR